MKHLHLTDELQEKAILFAAGALPEDERREFAHHLDVDACEICLAEVRELQAAAGFLAYSSQPSTPSPAVRARLMEKVQGASFKPQAVALPRRRWLEWTAGLAAVAASTALVFVMNQNVGLRHSLDLLTSRLAQLESQITEQRVVLTTLTSAQVRVVNLAGQGATAQASGRIFWDSSQRKWLFYAHNLPPVAADRSYQLWFVPKAGNPISASVFNTNGDGTVTVEVPISQSVDDLKAAAVTTEPAGGLPQPSGAFALLGGIQ